MGLEKRNRALNGLFEIRRIDNVPAALRTAVR
jgi:hypothetical protein